jgi:glycosyltransferase involved in cell wall biosynthesis
MIGGGNEKAGLEKIIKENNLADCIQIYSINSDVKALSEVYNSSDIFCLPTYTEGFPRVLYEAMFFSLPIITTNVGQISSLIHDDFNGLFCETRSINSLVNKLELLISDTNKRRTLGLNAKKTIEPLLHDWKNNSHGKQIIDLLRELEINIKSVK